MTQIHVSLTAFPLVLMVWTANAYLFMIALRLTLGQLAATRDSQICRGLAQCTDPLIVICQNWVEAHAGTRARDPWLWVAIILAILAVRHLCLIILISLSQGA